MPSPLIGGGIKRYFCLTSVCLSRTSGLSREQRGLGRQKLAQRQPTSLGHHFQRQKVKGQGHQAALVGCTGRPTWTYSNSDLSICAICVQYMTNIVSPLAGLGGGISWRLPAYSLLFLSFYYSTWFLLFWPDHFFSHWWHSGHGPGLVMNRSWVRLLASSVWSSNPDKSFTHILFCH